MKGIPLPSALLLATALLLPGGGVAAGEGDLGEAPAYELPAGFSSDPVLPDGLRAAISASVEAVIRPSSPHAAREGWRTLAGIGSDAAPACVKALGSADWLGRALLVRALGSMGDARLEPLLVAAAEDRSWAVREAAALGIAQNDGPASAMALRPLLSDRSWRVRQTALEATRRRLLLGTADRGTLREALTAIGADDDVDVRTDAWLALADLRHADSRDLLMDALQDTAREIEGEPVETSRPERDTAFRLLQGLAGGWPEDKDVRDLLRDMGADPSHPLAGHALEAWFRLAGDDALDDPRALAQLVDVYLSPHSSDPESRIAAERALTDAGHAGAEALLRVIAVPDRPRRMSLPFQRSDVRHVLELVLRILGDDAPDRVDSLMRDKNVSFHVRQTVADLGWRTFPEPLGPAFREVYVRDEGHYGLQSHLLKGIAASGGDDVRGIVSTALLEAPLPVRRAAAEILKDAPHLRDRAVLLSSLETESDGSLLESVLGVLRDLSAEDAPKVLAPFVADDRVQVRLRAINALARARGEATVRLLLDHLEREDGRDARVGVPGPTPRPPAVPDDGTDAEKEEAARRVEKWLHENGTREENRARVANSVVSSLRFAAGKAAATVLAALLVHEEPEVRRTAAANIASLGDPAASPALVARIGVETERDARSAMLAALVSAGGPEADEALDRWLAGGDEELRTQILEALQSRHAKAWPEAAVLRAIEVRAPGSEERLQALFLLGRRRDREYTPLLLELLHGSASREERLQALSALGGSGDPAAVPALAALLPEEDPSLLDSDAFLVAVSAADALGQIRAKEAVEPLASLLDRTLERAVSTSTGPRASTHRQVALVTMRALGRCGGPRALDTLARAAFHRGFSRAAEAGTTDPRVKRHRGARWKPEVVAPVLKVAKGLVDALSRYQDRVLLAAVDRRLAEMAADASDHSLSEEWLAWMAARFGHRPRRPPYRPRWWTRMRLLEQVQANAPRDTEADREASWRLYQTASGVTGDVKKAAEHLADWRRLTMIHDPARAGREREKNASLAAMLAAAAGETGTLDESAVESMARALDEGRDDPDVASLAAELLLDKRLFLDRAEQFALIAVRSDAAQPLYLRRLGEVRLARGDTAGAVAPLRSAFEMVEVVPGGPLRPGSGWYRYWLGRALTILGEERAARHLILSAAKVNDVLLHWIIRDPILEKVRDDERFEEALESIRVDVYDLPESR
ncbi:MAG: HEAT repeat domain-containing protein [Planctomycetota bacterium]